MMTFSVVDVSLIVVCFFLFYVGRFYNSRVKYFFNNPAVKHVHQYSVLYFRSCIVKSKVKYWFLHILSLTIIDFADAPTVLCCFWYCVQSPVVTHFFIAVVPVRPSYNSV